MLGREQERSRERSWGFCGDECFQDENIADSGILRFKDNIHVLSEKLCEHYVDASLFQTPQVESSQEYQDSQSRKFSTMRNDFLFFVPFSKFEMLIRKFSVLTRSMRSSHESSHIPQKVRPWIMCVANQNHWKEEVYVKEGNGYR